MEPTPEPVLIDCPAGYACRLEMAAVWPAEYALYLVAIIGVTIVLVALLIHLNTRRP